MKENQKKYRLKISSSLSKTLTNALSLVKRLILIQSIKILALYMSNLFLKFHILSQNALLTISDDTTPSPILTFLTSSSYSSDDIPFGI